MAAEPVMVHDSLADQQPPNGDQTSASGWYPDPLAAAALRFWDGERWTIHIHNRATPATGGLLGRGQGQTLIALGGLALAVSPFLTWVNVVLLGNLNLFQLLQAGGHRSGWAWVAVLAGGAVALDTWTLGSESKSRIVGVTVGLFAGAVAAIMLVGLVRDVRHADGLAAISYGPWVAFLACAAMVVGGLLPRRRAPGSMRKGSATMEPQVVEETQVDQEFDPLSELERLRALRDAGVLTAEEVQEQKLKILRDHNE